MFRAMLASALSVFLVTALSAAPSTQKEPTKPTERPAQEKVEKVEKTEEVSPEENPFNLTRETEVRLDGRLCNYDDIPDDAVVVNMQVARDRRTIIRIHFRSK